jgi:hypothetical protein
VECCDTILPFFDHLGPVFFVAKGEMQQKLEVLRSLVQDQPLLVSIYSRHALLSYDPLC